MVRRYMRLGVMVVLTFGAMVTLLTPAAALFAWRTGGSFLTALAWVAAGAIAALCAIIIEHALTQ